MRKLILTTGLVTVFLAGCSEQDGSGTQALNAPSAQFGYSEERMEAAAEAADSAIQTVDIAEPEPTSSDSSEIGPVAVGAPQIAYRFAYGFRLPQDAIKPLQERHADMCEARGPDVCRIISMKQADNEGDYSYGSLQIAVAAKEARAFGKALTEASGSVDGELVSSSIDGDDLSKRIVDTEARLRARTVLRDRLMEVLRTRRGTVAELVEAERGVAQVNEEIDQARSWLAEMKNRVAYSQMQVTYESGSRSSGSFIDPIREAWESIGSRLGSMTAFLISLIATLLPLLLLGWLLVWGIRKSGVRMPWSGWKRDEAKPSEE